MLTLEQKQHAFQTEIEKAKKFLREKKTMSDERLLQLARACRLTDLSDALDIFGLVGTTAMNSSMRPIRDGIKFCGFAYTVKLVPTQQVPPICSNLEELYGVAYQNFQNKYFDYYGDLKAADLRDRVVVFDAGGSRAGVVGSENSMAWKIRGATGVVVDGGVRDSAEANQEGMNIFSTVRTCEHIYMRVEGVASKIPVQCAGVSVKQGDLICADDDGVLVIPREIAVEVVVNAIPIRNIDMALRAEHYRDLGVEPDDSLVLIDL